MVKTDVTGIVDSREKLQDTRIGEGVWRLTSADLTSAKKMSDNLGMNAKRIISVTTMQTTTTPMGGLPCGRMR